MSGIATTNPTLVNSFTLPASIVNTTIQTVPITVAILRPTPAPQLFVVDGVVTSAPDNPGMVSYKFQTSLKAEQTQAVKSAAANTATAYGLNPIMAADQARAKNDQIYSKIFATQSANTVEEIIVPP